MQSSIRNDYQASKVVHCSVIVLAKAAAYSIMLAMLGLYVACSKSAKLYM